MKRTLSKIGLVLFPLPSLYCLLAFVILSLGGNSVDFRPNRAMRAAQIYGAVLLVSVVGFVGCLVVVIRARNRPGDFKLRN